MTLTKSEYNNYLIVLAGPTAVGKTSLAIHLAKILECEIFSCDSRQFYKEMNIGTAKPNEKELSTVKHHFINNKSVTEDYSVGQYEREIIQSLEIYFKKKPIAILTGGTGLYIKAVLQGFDEFPKIDSAVLEKLHEELNSHGITHLQSLLRQHDPVYYDQVDIHNPHRLLRALSVSISAGRPFSSFLNNPKKERPFTPILIFLHRDRKELYERIDSRVDKMISQGLIREVQLLQKFKSLNALNTVGYKEIFEYLDGEIPMERAKELIKRNSRRYAKRQITWFSNQGNFKIFHPDDHEEILAYINSQIEND